MKYIHGLNIAICCLLFSACSKPADSIKPVDESAAGKAAAIAASAAKGSTNEKANADLARIREIKEAEEARSKDGDASLKKFTDDMRKGAAAPIRQLKTTP